MSVTTSLEEEWHSQLPSGWRGTERSLAALGYLGGLSRCQWGASVGSARMCHLLVSASGLKSWSVVLQEDNRCTSFSCHKLSRKNQELIFSLILSQRPAWIEKDVIIFQSFYSGQGEASQLSEKLWEEEMWKTMTFEVYLSSLHIQVFALVRNDGGQVGTDLLLLPSLPLRGAAVRVAQTDFLSLDFWVWEHPQGTFACPKSVAGFFFHPRLTDQRVRKPVMLCTILPLKKKIVKNRISGIICNYFS